VTTGKPTWPSSRDDGSISVVARFETDESALDHVRSRLEEWVAEQRRLGRKLDDDLALPPTLGVLDTRHIEILIEARPGARAWKDWLVAVSSELTAIDGVRLEGFLDRVSGVFRPANQGP